MFVRKHSHVWRVREGCMRQPGIDPDTHDGVTRNVIVWRRCPAEHSPSWKQWDYHPTASLVKSGFSNGVELMFEEVELPLLVLILPSSPTIQKY